MARTPNPVRKRGRITILILFAISLLVPALMTLFGAVVPWTDTGTLDIDGVRTISVYPGYLEKDSLLYPVAVGWLMTLLLAFCPRKPKTAVIHSIVLLLLTTAVVVLVPLLFGDAGQWFHRYTYLLEDMNAKRAALTTVEYIPTFNHVMVWIIAGLMACANLITMVMYSIKVPAQAVETPVTTDEQPVIPAP